MIIDFHTHMFPDKIAGRTLDYLSGIFGASPFADGTYTGLCNSMGKGAVDISIALPAVTKVSQVASINRFASAYTEGPVISFGGIHPECENYKEILKEIKNLGLKGIKLHPDYQNFFADDEKAFPIYQKCSDLGLTIVFHAGFDPLSPYEIHGTAKAFACIHEEFPNLTMVLAHLGGMYRWEQTERMIAGTEGNVYLDVSCIAGEIGTDILKRIVEKHGVDRILFASDCPWDNPANEIKMINALDISQEDKEKIFYKNAAGLLGIKC